MTQITKETKEEISRRFPQFVEATRAFYAKELPPAKYKGTSGKFGSYGERGAHSSMLRLRFSGGAIESAHIAFLKDVLDRYDIDLVHFTTGEALQLHHLGEKEVLALYQECFDHGIYCVGAGSDNPRNITASPLHGVAPGEYFDMTPYIKAAANFVINCIPKFNLPRKYKISFSSGLDNEGHATFKDLGFVARPDHKFDVYAGGGFGLNGSRFGILIDEGVDPLDISYYILGYGRDVYMKYGDYEHRGQNRSRFILTKLGDDAFRQAVRDAVAKAKAEGGCRLTIEEETPLAKSGADDSVLEDGRIGKQKQAGLYYVEYKPLGGTPKLSVFRELLKTLQTMEGAEIRLNADETAYIINLTADVARKSLPSRRTTRRRRPLNIPSAASALRSASRACAILTAPSSNWPSSSKTAASTATSCRNATSLAVRRTARSSSWLLWACAAPAKKSATRWNRPSTSTPAATTPSVKASWANKSVSSPSSTCPTSSWPSTRPFSMPTSPTANGIPSIKKNS